MGVVSDHFGGEGKSTNGPLGSCPGGTKTGAGSPAAPRCLTNRYMARRSRSLMSRKANQGIGGRNCALCATLTHWFSESFCMYSRKLLGIGRAPGTAPAELVSHEPLLFGNLARRLHVAGRVAIVASGDLDEIPAVRERF